MKSTISSLLILIPIFAAACSPAAQPLVKTAPAQNEAPPLVLLRWFPVDSAQRYSLQVKDQQGELLTSETVQPKGCTHASIEGYTSGLCVHEFVMPRTDTPLVVTLDAVNQSGAVGSTIKLVPRHD